MAEGFSFSRIQDERETWACQPEQLDKEKKQKRPRLQEDTMDTGNANDFTQKVSPELINDFSKNQEDTKSTEPTAFLRLAANHPKRK